MLKMSFFLLPDKKCPQKQSVEIVKSIFCSFYIGSPCIKSSELDKHQNVLVTIPVPLYSGVLLLL